MNNILSSILLVFMSSFGYSTTINNGNNIAIDITETVIISNTNQVIRIKGSNIENPVLLYLNGGPGDSVLSQMDEMFSELQKDFTVILWDQRNSGKTSGLNEQNIQLTQELFKKDTYQLIKYLIQKFNKKKIVLVAHSYGTTLGFDVANNNPELLHAYVATNPVINQTESELITLEMLKNHAQKNKNTKAIKELSKVNIPFENGEELYYARKWLFDFEGRSFAKNKSFKKRILSWSLTWLELFNEASQENLFESTKQINCPVYFIIGQNDYQTNSILTHKYYNTLQAPQKKIYSIENAGHLIPYENRLEFQNAIKENVLAIIEGNK